MDKPKHILPIACLLLAHTMLCPGAGKVETKTFVAYSMKVAQQQVEAAEKSGRDFRKKQPDLYLLGSITKPQMIVIDTNHDDFILAGERDAKSSTLTLDDFAVAMRSRFLYPERDPGVTIDPHPCNACRVSRTTESCAHSTRQNVRYFSGVADSHFGQVCYEADWLMKRASFGFETLLPDLRSRYELLADEYRNKTTQFSAATSRFWFYPIVSQVNILPGLVLLEKFQMGVFTELLYAEIQGRPVHNLDTIDDRSAQSFARSFSSHFDRISEARPVLETLRGMTRLAALAKGISQSDERCAVDYWLHNYPLQKKATTSAVEVLTVENHQLGFRLLGGVELKALALRIRAGDSSSLREMIFAARREPKSSLFWEFTITIEDGQVAGVTVPATSADQKDVAPVFSQAVFLFHQKRFDVAREAYDRVLSLEPRYAEAYSDRGIIKRLQGDLKGAKADYRAAIQVNPRYAPPYINLGFLLLREGDVSGASDLCREAVAVAPYYPTAHANWGIALRHQGKLREAIAEYRRAIELNNADPVPHHNLGITLLLDGRVSAAVGEFEQAAQLHPDPPAHTWFHLGLALYEAGREADSLKAFEKQLRLSADNNVQSSEPLFSSYDFGTVLSTAPANDKYLREVAAQYVLMIREKLKSK